jgi:choline/glycine/proline betaine transport protein
MSQAHTNQDAPPPTQSRRGVIREPKVFIPAAAVLLVFVLLGAIMPERLGEVISAANTSVVTDLGWWYVLIVTGFVAFAVWLAISPMGSIRLGRDEEDPEFGLKSWFAMLFAAGMGIGLVFWGVAEPLNHFASPPPGVGGDEANLARNALDVTYLHWGLHAWAIYVVVGLAMAYAVHRKGRPVSIRWALEPLFGKRVTGVWGDVIDVIAIVGTIFGVATSLGFGVSQIGAGLAYRGVIGEATTTVLVVLIIAITGVAMISVVTGIEKGIRWLSNVNMGLAGLLMLAVLAFGPTVFLLSDFVQQIGSYLQSFLRLSFNTYSFRGEEGQAWLGGWTTYYWGWWMSWAPFVGVFIARISRGRTVREFISGVLLVPSLLTFLWFAIMGGSAIYREMFGEGGFITDEGVDTNTALFQLLDALPLAGLLSWIAIFLIVIFFVTSSDSGSYVVDMIASGGDPTPPVWSRAFWAGLEGVIAAVLLIAGGLAALQTMAILVALPFSIVMVLMVFATVKALMGEHRTLTRLRRQAFADRIVDQVNADDGTGTAGAGTTPVGTR